jgi:hypothetical protein
MSPTHSHPLGGYSRQSSQNVQAGYLARNQLERLPLNIMGIPLSDPHNTIQPLQTVEPRRDNLRNSHECDLVRNPCMRGESQED